MSYHKSAVLPLEVKGRATWVEDVRLENLLPGAAELLHSVQQVVFLQCGVGHSRTPCACCTVCHSKSTGGHRDDAGGRGHALQQQVMCHVYKLNTFMGVVRWNVIIIIEVSGRAVERHQVMHNMK